MARSAGSLPPAVRDGIQQALDTSVVTARVVHGGDVAAAFRLELRDGRIVFAKTHPAPPAGFFTTEASGLSWLRGAHAVSVPEVLAVSDGVAAGTGAGFLVLRWVEASHDAPATEERFGRALAHMHDAGARCFGREDRRTTGSRALPNDPQPTWAAFYASCRLLPLAALARRDRSLDAATVTRLERLAETLERFDDGGPPARLHGDLWAGNRIVDASGNSWLVDPAAHGGHREFDLAMMRLFGGFGPRCFTAYEEVHPLTDGWQERVALHQIAPLVVHAIKFGGGYVRAAAEAITRY